MNPPRNRVQRTWTNELRERRIRVKAISPSYTDTPISAQKSYSQAHPLTRFYVTSVVINQLYWHPACTWSL